MKYASAVSAGIIGTLLVPLTLWAKGPMNPDYRECMQEATNRRESEYINVTIDYGNDMEDIFRKRRNAFVNAWNLETKTAIDKAAKLAKKDYDAMKKETEARYADRKREVERVYTADKRECRDMGETVSSSSSTSSLPSGTCYNSNSCSSNQVCSTEYGECRPVCYPGSAQCIQVCSGRCVPRQQFNDCDSNSDCRSGYRCSSVARCVLNPI